MHWRVIRVFIARQLYGAVGTQAKNEPVQSLINQSDGTLSLVGLGDVATAR
jgi:hypothetical protein